MDRREAIKRTSLLLGTTVIGSEIFISGCVRESKETSLIFDVNEISLMDEIGETILPESDQSPGAKAAKIGSFMAVMVGDCYGPEEQKIFSDGLGELNERSVQSHGSNFIKLSMEDKTSVLTELDREASQWQKEGKLHYYTLLKQLTILGYFTSEIGVTQALRYNPVPKGYDGCVPYADGNRAWYGPLSSIG